MDNVRNPLTMEESDPFSNIILKDKDNFGVAEFKDVANTITNNQPDMIVEASLKQEVFVPAATTTYEIAFTPKNEIPTQGSFIIQWPD